MSKNILPVDFKDDIMNSAMGGKRRYRMINNSDGTISLEDATTYDQVGSNFGAAQINATNKAVNAAADAGKIIDDLDAINNVTQEGYIAGARALKQVNDSLVNENNESFNFGVKDGVRGFFTDPSRADDSFIPFKCMPETFSILGTIPFAIHGTSNTYSFNVEKGKLYVAFGHGWSNFGLQDNNNLNVIYRNEQNTYQALGFLYCFIPTSDTTVHFSYSGAYNTTGTGMMIGYFE